MSVDTLDCPITLREDDHTYWHDNGLQYVSVSELRKEVEEPFLQEEIARNMAVSSFRKLGSNYNDTDIILKKNSILQEWKEIGVEAMRVGSVIDHAVEVYLSSGKVLDPKMEPLMKGIWMLLENYGRRYTKKLVWSEKHHVAGETDIFCCRRAKNIVDIYDTKVAVRKKIEYLSKNNKYFLPPLDHLEHCTYNDYSMQLSVYALLCELCYGLKPGKLTIIQIYADDFSKYKLIPVPYLKFEAWSLLENHKKSKQVNF